MSRVKIAVIPAAGFGTRMLPATKAIPKELLPVVDRPVIDYVASEAIEAGIEHIVFVVSRGKEPIETYFDHQPELEAQLIAAGKTAYLEQVLRPMMNQGRSSFVRQGKALGLGHAIWSARHVVGDEPFAVLLPDVICTGTPGATKRLVDLHEETGGCAITVNPVPDSEVHKYGIIRTDGTGADAQGRVSVTGLVEKPARGTQPSNLAITGRYVLTPEVFDHLEMAETGAGGEIQLTDSMVKLIGHGPFHAVVTEDPVYDCGDQLGWLEANLGMARRQPALWDGLADRGWVSR